MNSYLSNWTSLRRSVYLLPIFLGTCSLVFSEILPTDINLEKKKKWQKIFVQKWAKLVQNGPQIIKFCYYFLLEVA